MCHFYLTLPIKHIKSMFTELSMFNEVLGFFNCKISLYNEVKEKYIHLNPFLDWLGCSTKIVYISKC